jgi:hypothetical protein
MGRRKGMETTLLKQNNSIQDSVGNEENGYPVPDPNKIMINVTKEPGDNHQKKKKKKKEKKTLREEILKQITEKFMEKILNMVKQNVQDALKKYQETKNKDYENTYK